MTKCKALTGSAVKGLIKTFNKSSMKDERLSGLAMIVISIQSDMARRLDTTFVTSSQKKSHFSGD